MNLIVLLSALVALASAQNQGGAQAQGGVQLSGPGGTTQKPALAPGAVVIDKAHKAIDTNFPGWGKLQPNQVGLDAARDKVDLDLKTRNQHAVAGSRPGFASATGPEGKGQGTATLYKGAGGLASAGTHKGVMRNNKVNGNSNANFTADGKYVINTQEENPGADGKPQPGQTRFWGNSTQNRYGLAPVTQDKDDGKGSIYRQNDAKGSNDFYLYEIKQNQGNGDQDAFLTQSQGSAQGKQSTSVLDSLLNNRQKQYHCTGQKIGSSTCQDQNGRTVGKVVADAQGNTVVYNSLNIPVYRGKATKEADGKYAVQVNQGLLAARTTKLQEYDCMQEVTGQAGNTQQIEVMKPIIFKYNNQDNTDGTRTWKWPDCFEMGATVKLGPTIDPSRLATEWIVNVLPIGRLRCTDVATCGRDCYYCDYCQEKGHKLNILNNGDTNICDPGLAGKTVKLTATLCPPPEDANWAMCSKFSKSLLEKDYWGKKGAIDCQMRFYLRPANEDALRKEFFDKTTAPFIGSATKLALSGQWALENKAGQTRPSDAELIDWYIRKNGKEQLIGCKRAIIDYSLAGEKVNTNFLIEAAGSAGSVPSIFQGAPCPQWSKLQDQDFQRQKAQYDQSKAKSGGGGIFGGLFNG